MNNNTPFRVCPQCAEPQPATYEYFAARKDGQLRSNHPCRKCIASNERRYNREYARQRADERADRARRWHKGNPYTQKIRTANQRALARGLAGSLTAEQWLTCLNYWNSACAICGCIASEAIAIALDHWIPIDDPRADNPGTQVNNVLPLCHSRGGTSRCCNNTKHNRDPLEWLLSTFGRDVASERLAAVNAYFSTAEKGLLYVLPKEQPAYVPSSVQLSLFE